MISDNVEFLPPIFIPCFGNHFENGRHLENFENAELLLWLPKHGIKMGGKNSTLSDIIKI
jgi:hypothetical protein